MLLHSFAFNNIKMSRAGGEAPAKRARVSANKKNDGALAALQHEVETTRLVEQLSFIEQECRASSNSLDQCFAQCTRNERKSVSESNVHRNVVVIGQLPGVRKAEGMRKLSFTTEECYQAIESHKATVHEIVAWVSKWSSQTEIGVSCIPICNLQDVLAARVRRVGVTRESYEILIDAKFIDSNFIHGPFGMCRPVPPGKHVTHVVHHWSGIKAALPFGFKVPIDQVALPSLDPHKLHDKFYIARWGLEETASLKGPNGLSINILKLFPENVLIVSKPPPYIIETFADQELACRPSILNPDTPLQVKNAVIAYLASHEASGSGPHTPAKRKGRILHICNSPASNASLASSPAPETSPVSSDISSSLVSRTPDVEKAADAADGAPGSGAPDVEKAAVAADVEAPEANSDLINAKVLYCRVDCILQQARSVLLPHARVIEH